MLLASLALALPARALAERLVASATDGRVVVKAYKDGLLSGFAHDHRFLVRQWTAEADLPEGDPARATVRVVLTAASLHDEQEKLSDEDRRKVDAQATGPDVLDAGHHPRIELRSERIVLAAGGEAGKARGTLHGTLSVRGRTVPIAVPFEAERAGTGWKVRGTAHLKQSDVGIRPFSGYGGTVKVKDELDVELALHLVPAPR
jgi:polyisoprenoid-binding protein YceI